MSKLEAIPAHVDLLLSGEQRGSKSNAIPQTGNTKILSGLKMLWWHFRICLSLLATIVQTYANPFKWIPALKYLRHLRKQFLGNFRLKKLVKVDGKYYMGLYTPGWQDSNYKMFIRSELNHFKPVKGHTLRFNHVHVAITKKCALQCEHCYAWDVLNQKDFLSEDDLKRIIGKLQNLGTGQIHLTGGEPLIKSDLLIRLLETSNNSSNFWINTSGYKLTEQNAANLKKAGLTGVLISLDHFETEKHNSFRNYKDAYYWAVTGAKNAIANKLVVALSICVTNLFVNEKNLMEYMKLAKALGVHFVQFLEPKDVGHYKGKTVNLIDEKIETLECFYSKMNFSNDFLEYPIISYHGYYQRRVGCFSGGNRGMYVDTDGNLNACPFCHTNSGNILCDTFESDLKKLTRQGCPKY